MMATSNEPAKIDREAFNAFGAHLPFGKVFGGRAMRSSTSNFFHGQFVTVE